MKMTERLTVKKCAELMGVSEQFIRIGLQKERFPFGFAVQTSDHRWTYFISRSKFEESTGIKV